MLNVADVDLRLGDPELGHMRLLLSAARSMQGFECHARKRGDHVAYESNTWLSAFNLELNMFTMYPLLLKFVTEVSVQHCDLMLMFHELCSCLFVNLFSILLTLSGGP